MILCVLYYTGVDERATGTMLPIFHVVFTVLFTYALFRYFINLFDK